MLELPRIIQIFLSLFRLAHAVNKGVTPEQQIVQIVKLLHINHRDTNISGNQVLPLGVNAVIMPITILERIVGQL